MQPQFEPREPVQAGTTVLWTNPFIKKCPDCHFMDADADVVQTHRLNQHPQALAKVFAEDPGLAFRQLKLGGGAVTDDDRRAAILAAIPDERYACPFCLTTFPHSRVTRFFLDDGKLSKMVLCRKDAGGCGKRMQAATMTVTRSSPLDFGRFVGAYPKFWGNVEHDAWMKKLKALYPNDSSKKWDDPNQPMAKFWEGYGDCRPEWKEKQRIAKAAREYEEATKGSAADDDTSDEGGR